MFWNHSWLNSSVLNPSGAFERGFCLVSFNSYTNMKQMFSFISCVISPTLHILVCCFWQWWKAAISQPFVFWVLHKLSCSVWEYFLLLICSCFLIWKAALEVPDIIAVLELSFRFCACVHETEACPYKRKASILLDWRACSIVTKILCQDYVNLYLKIVLNCCLIR